MAAALTACNNVDDSTTPQTYTIDFEQVVLDADGRSLGTDTHTQDASNTYDIYSESCLGAKFDTWLQETPWFFWWGWAFSDNATAEYQSDYSHQYATPVGAYSGEKYAICYRSETTGTLYSPSIKFDKAVKPQSVMVTNSTTTICYVKGEDSFSQWSADDKTTLLVTGYRGATPTGTVTLTLAEGNSYIDEWVKLSLEELGQVDRLEFSISSTDVGDWGMNAPAYVCIDNLIFVK